MKAGSLSYLLRYSLIKPTAIPYYRRVMGEQYLPTDQLDHVNWQRTQELLSYAFKNVPFYRERWQRLGLNPLDITRPEHYGQVPPLTRDDLQESGERLISEQTGRHRLRESTTGGSSGKPVKVYHQRNVVRAAMGWRMMRWWGVDVGAPIASVYRAIPRSRMTRWGLRFLSWPHDPILLDAAKLDERSMRGFLNQMRRVRPAVLHGYVGAVDHLASFMLDHNLRVPSPKVVWLTSAPITRVQEQTISAAFEAPVCDQYGCCEVYWLAAECPEKRGLHMFHDVRRIEFLDDHHNPLPSGEMGQIAITDLENRLYPIIRYLNGDRGRAIPESCSCGRSLPLMDKVRGRVAEVLLLPDGSVVSGEFLTTIFDDDPALVKQFQLHQQADLSVRVRIVPGTTSDGRTKCVQVAQNNVRALTRGQVPITVELVESIPNDRGKLQFIVSDVKDSPG